MKTLKLTAFFLFSSIGSLAFADTFFQTPSGNIICQGQDSGVTCLMGNAKKTISTSCGKADTFEINKNSQQVQMRCGGDAGDVEPITLEYGKSLSSNGWLCKSETTGIMCKNNKNHGFNLNRTQQRIF